MSGRCGDHGGRTKAGAPCGKPAGWGRDDATGRCRLHARSVKDVRPGVNNGDSLPEPPGHLSPESAELWRQTVERYWFGIEGLPLLENALTALDRAREARRDIEENGIRWTNPDSGAVHVNPSVRVERDALKEFRLTWMKLDLPIEDGP